MAKEESVTAQPSVIVVTPAHNEASYLPTVGKGLVEQTRKPTQWIIVDDNSNDATFDIGKALSRDHSWITVVKRAESKIPGDQSFQAFVFGLSGIEKADFLVKLDGDTTLPPDYFEVIIRKFMEDGSLGIASGVNEGEEGIESHPRGNNRVYRFECWRQISFPSDGWGWDTVDEVFARLNGWQTTALAKLTCKHLRSRLPDPKYRFFQGQLSRHLGYYWWFVLGRAAKLVLSSGPFPSLGYLAGYIRGGLGSTDSEIKKAIKRDQINRLRGILVPGAKSNISIAESESLVGKEPFIVIGMPTKNRARYLPRVLKALHECDYPKKKVRLVFVDANSTDGTFELLQQFAQENGPEYEEVRVLREEGNIPSARNVCIQQIGNSDYLVFLDSDVLVEPDFIRVLIKLSKIGAIASILYGSSDARVDPGIRYAENVGMGCTLIRKDTVVALGQFDETLSVGEDTDYCLRARANGFKIVQDNRKRFMHFDEGRYRNEGIIWRSFRNRRVYAKICRLGVYSKRFLMYLILDVCLASGLVLSYLFLLPLLAYFLAQLGKGSGIKLAFLVTLNSLIIVPLTLVGLLERKLGRL